MKVNIVSNLIQNKLLTDAAYGFAAKILATLLTMIFDALLARMITKEELGLWFMLYKAVTLLSLVCCLGVQHSMVKFGNEYSSNGERRYNPRKLLLLSYCSVGLMAVFVSVGYFLILKSPLYESSIISSIAALSGVTSVWIFFRTLQPLTTNCFLALGRQKIANNFGPLLPIILSVSMVLYYKSANSLVGLDLIILIFALSICISVVLSVLVHLLIASKVSSNDEDVPLRALVIFSGSAMISQIFLDVFSKIDVWMVGLVSGTDDAAVYGCAARIVAMVGIFLVMRDALLGSRLSKLHSKGRVEDINSLLKESGIFGTYPSIIVCLILIVSSEKVISIVYGEVYLAAVAPLQILCVGTIIRQAFGPVMITMMMLGEERKLMLVAIIIAIFGTLAGIFAGEVWGVTGVATAISIANCISSLVCCRILWKEHHVYSPIFKF